MLGSDRCPPYRLRLADPRGEARQDAADRAGIADLCSSVAARSDVDSFELTGSPPDQPLMSGCSATARHVNGDLTRVRGRASARISGAEHGCGGSASALNRPTTLCGTSTHLDLRGYGQSS